MLVSSTSELISKLQEYEKYNGVGAIRGISIMMEGDRKINYILRVANDSYDNEILNNQDEHYQETTIEISAIKDIDLFTSSKKTPTS